MTTPPPLSPAAQAVLDAFRAVPDLRDRPSIAAALRAAADQVLPHSAWGDDRDSPAFYRWQQKMKSRSWFLNIAAELAGESTTETTDD